MLKTLLTPFVFLFGLIMMTVVGPDMKGQQTVFTETFNAPGTPQNPAFTTSGPIGSSKWAVTRSGNDFGAKIDQGFLTLTNDVGSIGNVKGWVLASTSTSNFLPAYNPILSQNAGIVSWTFNMRQLRTNPAGLTDGLYGVGYVLAGTEGSTNKVGKGYAIMLGQSGNKDAIRFVTYNNGIQTYYTKLSSTSSGLSDFGREYTSIRVEYNPLNNEWSLYLRKDNTSSFNDPNSGTLVYQGKIANAEFVNEPLTMTGAYWNAATAQKQTAFFDNIAVSVVTPEIISINPDSKIANSGAFTLTLDGKGFTSASRVYWNNIMLTPLTATATKLTVTIPNIYISTPAIIPITVRNGSFISNALAFEIEPSGVPSLTLSKNILPFISTVAPAASAATETYTITGSNLTAGQTTVTAPSNFEISRDGGATYFNSLTLASAGGPLTDGTVTLRARLKQNSPAGNYTGNITHTANGAVAKNVAVSGRVLAIEPTTSATIPTYSNITSTGFKLSWTNSGNGEQRVVLIRQATAVNGVPVDATTYNANAAFATGSLIGTDNYVVYKGNGNFVQITGLEPSKLYHISIIEFNGLPGTENYRTVGLIGSATTLNSPAGLQVKVANTSYKIDFDNTVDGVNLDTFQGSGIAKIAEPGQLDSDSWAFTGFSGGTINFGGESVEDSSYENGPSDGDEVDTGMYAFNVGTAADENYTLGIQPGGTDFNPGTITLRIQNQTGAAATSFNIGYKVYIYNDQASSSKIGFSYLPAASADGSGTYTSVSTVDVTSPSTADLAPGWKAYYRVVTINPTTAIANNAYFYIRWSGSLVSGAGAQDEFAIDDIEVIANPTTNTVAFDGNAEDFVLQGNASLSNDLSVQNRLVFNGGKLAIKDKTLTIASVVENISNGGLIGGADSNIIIKGTKNPSLYFDQTSVATRTLKSLSLIGDTENTVAIVNGDVVINQSLNIDVLQKLDLRSNLLGGTLNSIINNGTIVTVNASANPFPNGKSWNGTGLVHYNSPSTVHTVMSGTYNDLRLSSTGGSVANGNITVNGDLQLPKANPNATKGSLDMASFTLLMGPNGVNSGLGDVTGIITRNTFVENKLYTFGHPNSSITFPPAGTLPTSMSAKLTIGVTPTWRAGTVQRQFDIIQSGGSATKAIIRMHYLDSEVNSNVESKLVFWAHTVSPLNTFDQGRSNNNTTENWVEISNADIGLYFKPAFNQVYITLDETSGSDLVWNGSTSTSWNTGANWTPNGTPNATTKILIPNVSTTSNRSPIIDATSSVKTITIDIGGVVNTPSSSVLNVFDGAGAWQNNGTFNAGNGTVIFNSIDATISGTTTFNNLTIATGAGLRALEGNKMSIAGTFTNNGTMFTTLIPNTIEFTGTNQIIPDPKGEAFGGYHHLIVSGTGTTLVSTITTLNVRGNLTLNQSVPFLGKTINFAGVSDQTIGGTAAINFNSLVVNKETGTVILAKDISVGGTLTLTKGNVVIGANNLTLGSNAVAGTFGTNTMIVADGAGVVRRPFVGIGSYLFPIGELDGAPSYAPITVNVTAGTFTNAFVGVNVTHAKHPDNKSSQNYLRKYWNVKQEGIANAVATITATYEAANVLGGESNVAAAQLNGAFNIDTNPWIKFGPLSNNTLTATNVTLTSGQNSVFTGLKAGSFTLEVYDYGDFCINSEVLIHAVVTGGDAPFTYNWSNGLPNAAEVLLPTSVVSTTNYTLTVIDANGFSATDANIPVEIFPASVGGTIANATQQICASSLPAYLQLSGSVGKVLHWQKSTDENFETFENISNFTTTLTGAQIGPIIATTYIRAVLQNGDCEESISTVATITIKSTTWTGTSWSNGDPNSSTAAIFQENYTASSNFNACSMVVESGKTITIPSETSMTIQNNIINNGNIIVKSDGNLFQVNDNAAYTGDPVATFVVERDAIMKRLDYVYWSSPVEGQNLKVFSPKTVVSRFLTYNEYDDKFTSIDPGNTSFAKAKGYAIRADNTYKAWTWNAPESIVYNTFKGIFKGTPHNGKVSYQLEKSNEGNGFNLIGNPYPSNIDFHALVATGAIKGTAYFWTNVNPTPATQQGSAYDGLNYATYTFSGGVPSTNGPIPPERYIKVGQGFIVQAEAAGPLVLTNAMRNDGTGPSKFINKGTTSNNDPIDRFWLKLITPAHNFNTILIAYPPGATNGFDSFADAQQFGESADSFYTILNDYKLNIQGRQFPVVTSDIIPVGMKGYETGEYKIAMVQKEGIFANGQNIYLKDKQNNTVTNLSAENYTFTKNAGLTEGRFEIIYENDLVLGTGSSQKEELAVYRDGTDFVIKAASKKITHVELFDTSGRLILQLNPNQSEVKIEGHSLINGIYVLKINQNGKITTRKISR